MHRRDFAMRAGGAITALVLDPARALGRFQDPVRVNGQRLIDRLDALGRFGRNQATGGINRTAYSEADRDARAFVADLMRSAGLEVTIDAGGNLIGRRGGTDATLAPIMFGSHIDSVPEGGNYDGPVGSMAAIEVMQTLADQRLATRHPLELAIFSNEEGGKTGSRALSGEVRAEELDLMTASGRTIRDGIAFIGGEPGALSRIRREPGSLAAFFELHVEQGGVLDRRRIPVGVVEGIVGIKRWNVTVDGFANHAGTTPMDQRQDPMLAAGRLIDAVHRVARTTPGRQVATVGRLEAEPGAPNVIPGRVTLSLEVRDLAMEKIDRVFADMQQAAESIGRDTGTTFGFAEFYVSHAAPTDARLRAIVAEAAADLGLETLALPSGAGHDAQSIARLAPIGMIFVPSERGISHSPLERTAPADVVNGANVLLACVRRADTAQGLG